ncbi:MAG: hypothetical protein EKK61_06595 [Rickettsiales bacterium]|nr:MAG: hypothetical protein EKK61_06595 [Rickettsiales bacterium]
MSNKDVEIWVLVDHRIGNANQAIDLAEMLDMDFEIKKIEYNFFSKLPNSFLSLFPFHVKWSILSQIKKHQCNKIIISAGRRTAALAVYLKKNSGTEYSTKIIQIMRPDIDPQQFDLIILPQHDSFNHILPNLVRIIGALTNTKNKIQKNQDEFDKYYRLENKYIAVIIGGSTKKYKLTLDEVKIFAETLSNISKNHELQLFITFSRRTPSNVKAYLQNKFAQSHIIYDPANGGSNPYPVILSKAEYIILTADSITMCSESASTGKPLYIYCSPNFKLKKHNFFIQQLVDLGIARRFDVEENNLKHYNYTPLAESAKVAAIIKTKIF